MTGHLLWMERFSKLSVASWGQEHNPSFSSILISYLNVTQRQWAEKSCYLRAAQRHSHWWDTAAAAGATEARASVPLQTCTHKYTHMHSKTPPYAMHSSQPHLESSNSLPVLSHPPPVQLCLLPPSPHTSRDTPPSLLSSPSFSSSAFTIYILSLTHPPLHGRIKVLGTTYTEHSTDYTCQLHDTIERQSKPMLGLVFSQSGLTLGKIQNNARVKKKFAPSHSTRKVAQIRYNAKPAWAEVLKLIWSLWNDEKTKWHAGLTMPGW